MEELIVELFKNNSGIAIFALATIFGVKHITSINKELAETRIMLAKLEVKVVALTQALADLNQRLRDK